jgi:pimeloyl-ACP methyl ester carboxylesterase
MGLFALSGFGLRGARAQTAGASKAKTYVIVHGAWGGSWAFRRVGALLGAQGHTVYRPSLTGQGERAHLATPEIGLGTHIEDVVNVLLYEELKDVVLVGHSYGGMVITGVADRLPDRVRHLVYLDAFVPENGESALTIQRPGGTDWLKPMISNGFIVPPWVKPDQPAPKDVPQSLKTFSEAIVLKNEAARKLPATYILTMDPGKTTDDFSPQADRAKARGWTVLQLTADHNPQWSAPDALVGMLGKIG